MADYNQFRTLSDALNVKQAVEDVELRSNPASNQRSKLGNHFDASDIDQALIRRVPVYDTSGKPFANQYIENSRHAVTLNQIPTRGTLIHYSEDTKEAFGTVVARDESQVVVKILNSDQAREHMQTTAINKRVEVGKFNVNPVTQPRERQVSRRQLKKARSFYLPGGAHLLDNALMAFVATVIAILVALIWVFK